MDQITSFLEKFKIITPSHDVLREQCKKVIQDTTGIVLEKKQIIVQGNTIKLSCRSGQKNEIILHKQTILEFIHTHNPESGITTLL